MGRSMGSVISHVRNVTGKYFKPFSEPSWLSQTKKNNWYQIIGSQITLRLEEWEDWTSVKVVQLGQSTRTDITKGSSRLAVTPRKVVIPAGSKIQYFGSTQITAVHCFIADCWFEDEGVPFQLTFYRNGRVGRRSYSH